MNNENKIEEEFIEKGFFQFVIEDRVSLDQLRQEVLSFSSDPIDNLSTIHQKISTSDINNYRMDMIRKINAKEDLREKYYQLGKTHLDIIVGNELAIQKNINLSIQMPGDETSTMALHRDCEAGNSPFEVVLWIPLTDSFASNSIQMQARNEGQLKALTVPYGNGLVFSHSLLHGNLVNKESKTRVSINLRFKSLWAPYGNKGLGESFLPLNMKAATRIGIEYES
ncbi:MAG: hypothetical protein HN509_15760 [Halobacteriovoraceae bacterium]|jgi:hypothetical protein|nr:hypothetical protein [Halobacteriovoraceae bacterium]MBT5094586.1 hypothetical protein [Halobacteriovoraceae bacterium]